MSALRPNRIWLLQFTLVCLAYYVGGRVGLSVPYVGSFITLIWPPTGIAMAALLCWRLSLWPAIWIGAFLVNLHIGSGIGLAFSIACGNTLGPLVAAWLLRRLSLDRTLAKRRDLMLYLGVAVFGGMAINATNGVIQLWLAGVLEASAVWEAWITWWFGDAMGALVLGVPLLTANRDVRRQVSGTRGLELGCVLLLMLMVSVMIFVGQGDASPAHPLLYVPFLLICWLAIRGGAWVGSTAALLLSALAVWSTANGLGPFQAEDIHFSLAMLWGYMATATIITVLLTIMVGELRSSESRLALATVGAELGMWEWDVVADSISYIGDQDTIALLKDEGATRCGWLASVHPGDSDELQALLDSHLAGKTELFEATFRVQGARQGWIWLLSRGQVVDRNAQGVPLKMAGTLVDITDRKLNEQELRSSEQRRRQSEERYRLLLNNSPVGILHYSRDLIVTYANARFEEIVRVPRGHMHGFDCNALKDKSVLPALGRALEGEDAHYNGPYVTTFGCEHLWISMECAPVRNDEGGILGGIAIIEDITERMRIEAALSESERRFRATFEQAAVGVANVGLDGCWLRVNERLCDIVGYSREEMLGLSFQHLTHVDDRASSWSCLQRFLAGEIDHWQMEKRYLRKNGEVIWVALTISLLRNSSGEPDYFITVIEDISDRKRIEEHERRQRQGLAALNEIAALSHLPLSEQLKKALSIVAAQLDLEFGIVSHISADTYTVVEAISPEDMLKPGQRFSVHETYCEITLRQSNVVAISEMGVSPFLSHPCYEAFRLEAYIGAPVRVAGKVYGTVNFSSAKPCARPFDEADKEFVRLLASWVGSALERNQARTQLAESEARLQTIIENEPECVKVLNAEGYLLQMNRAGLDMLEVATVEEANEVGVINFVAPEYRGAFEEVNNAAFSGATQMFEFKVVGKKGRERWLDTHVAPLKDADGQVVAALSVTRDITARKESEAKLKAAASVFSHAHEGIMICDSDRRLIDVNPTYTEITGFSRAAVLGKTPDVLTEDYHGGSRYQEMIDAIASKGQWKGEFWSRRKDGTEYLQRLTLSCVRESDGQIKQYIGTFADITLLKRQQERLEYLAHYDALTQLPNRALLSDRLVQALAQAKRNQTEVAVCYLDLDGFKAVNDALGHDAGDTLLIEIARRLQNVVRGGDTVARLGGDEFVMLLIGIRGEAECDVAINRILQEITRPVLIKGKSCSVSGSIGIALYPIDDSDADTLIRHADQAMYAAKQAGKNRYTLYSA
ncbi:MAG: PAS domain S-box protein [Oceanospirillales bacterium]|nr:PAS domain S-box protein [Oceanospirillales bacterium]